MTDDVEQVLKNATPDIWCDRFQSKGFDIYAIWYGYRQDSLSNLFPILFIADQEKGHKLAMTAVRECIQSNSGETAPEISVKAPGTYGSHEEARWLESSVRLYRLQEEDGRPDRSDDTMRGVRNRMFKQLQSNGTEDDPENCFFTTDEGEMGLTVAKFEFSFGRHHPEVNIPFLDERPESVLANKYRDLQLPCYLLTNQAMERRDRIYPDVYWYFPIR